MGPTKKEDLLHYLQVAREALLWKLDGLSEYDIRRPLTATGTNLLGLVKHLASVELGYFGDVFGRPSGDPAALVRGRCRTERRLVGHADESREEIVGLYRQAWEHSDATIRGLGPRCRRPCAVVAGGPQRSRCTCSSCT